MAEPAETTKLAVEGVQVDSPMEAQVQKLAEKVWNKYQALDESQRYLLAIAGIPGSGKTTFAASLAYHLNQRYQDEYHKKYPNAPLQPVSRNRALSNGSNHGRTIADTSSPQIARVLPMDGFHFTRAQLSAMPNSEEAHYRRGAAFTFDGDAYLKLVEKLRKPIEPTTRTVWAPSFDHATKDPVNDDIAIPPSARIVIVEGLYTALSYPPPLTESSEPGTKAAVPSSWSEACVLMDEIWLIQVPIPVATERVAKRNFKAGLSPSLEAAVERTLNNDMKNAREILDNLPPDDKLTERIESVADEAWMTEEQKVTLENEQQQRDEKGHESTLQRIRLNRMGSIAEMAEAGVGM
ncbi:hypothetical protein LTR05_001408 [Lithohypha guttulata]|uniref:Phosphoribulokinase/uridine kinase domain-containing protein n=1 Tax=Lithohypha guttulata TaxID=1690604 RepID=A0AAN7YAB8_9EURO|nr:hypothetical protein LTR05_001408 [Lithohypha guttulata]